jgi:hypothetical protein
MVEVALETFRIGLRMGVQLIFVRAWCLADVANLTFSIGLFMVMDHMFGLQQLCMVMYHTKLGLQLLCLVYQAEFGLRTCTVNIMSWVTPMTSSHET